MDRRLALTLALAVFVCPRGAFAQSAQLESDAAAPAHVSYVEGAATLERDGRPENAPLNMPILSGDRIRTAAGRVEIMFPDGSALHLDSRTTLDIQSDELVRLIDGRLRLTMAGSADSAQSRAGRGLTYRIDSPAGSVRITQPGEYRIALVQGRDETQLELAVLRGSGEIFTDDGQTAVRAGERAYASAGLAPSYAYAYNSANWDGFDRWSESRRDARLGVSTQYLPSEVRSYASTFDEDGDWRYQQAYGYVWYPRVDVSWRPYYYGRWAQYPRYGWTWIGADRFAWPTHHYGRWGFSAGTWFWIPASRWAPAYVSWAYAPGYVSWCPLGFDNRPVISVNIFNVGPGYYSSSRAWTSVGYSSFGHGYAHQRAVNWDRYDRGRRPSFQIAHSAPAYRDVAVPRNSAPVRRAGSRDVPLPSTGRADARGTAAGDRRSSTAPSIEGSANGAVPRYINRGDAIVRSQNGRPSAPIRPSSEIPGAPAGNSPTSSRAGSAVQRTAPGGPARRIDAPGAIAMPDGVAAERWRGARDPNAGRYAPRQVYQPPQQRQDAPAYQPRQYQQPARTYQPNDGAPERSRAPQPGVAVPRQAPQDSPSSQGYTRSRGGNDPRASAPGGTEPRQAPAPRAMPAPERSAPGQRAVPRESGGRPAAPASGGSGTRSRGRGGR